MAWLRFIKEKLVVANMLIIMGLIVLATVFAWYNKQRIVETTIKKQQAEEVKSRLAYIFREYLRGMDLGLRGYALTKNKQVLSPYENALKANATNLRHLDSLFRAQKLDTVLARFEKIKAGIESYVETTKQMKAAVERDSIKTFVRILNQDKGYDLWVLFSPFSDSVNKFEDNQITKAQSDYESALNWNILIQIFLFALGLPSIGYIVYKINTETRERNLLLNELEENNEKYLFNPGDHENHSVGFQESINQSIGNFRKAVKFIQEISNKNFDARWEGINKSNIHFNEHTLAGELIKMRNQMKLAKEEDDHRFWVNDGLAQFSQLVRQHQSNLTELCQHAASYLSHYVNAQQGSLYVQNNEEGGDIYLQLVGGFANGASETKRIEAGEGLVGQAFLNGETMLLNDAPPSLIQIASGLGHAKPASLCIVPLKYNTKTEAILELSSFKPFAPHAIGFLQKAGEFIASAIVSAKVSSKMEVMLKDSMQRAEEMHNQEEEMRQNLEELTATQEEIHRQSMEAKDLSDTMISILNQLPQKIFLKDENGRMVVANLNVAKTHNLSVQELIGKSDFDFVDSKTAQEWRNQELEIIKKGRETYTFDETLNGHTRTLTTEKMAFYIPHLKQTGLLGIQTDITEMQALKKRLGS